MSNEILNKTVTKYYCNWIGSNVTCNDKFYNLMNCISTKCIFENDEK